MWQMQEILFLAKSMGLHVVWGRDVLRHDFDDNGKLRTVFRRFADTTVYKGQGVAVQSADWTRTVATFTCWQGSNNGTGEALLEADEPTRFTRYLMLNRLGMLDLSSVG
jgi:hypothetical protein